MVILGSGFPSGSHVDNRKWKGRVKGVNEKKKTTQRKKSMNSLLLLEISTTGNEFLWVLEGGIGEIEGGLNKKWKDLYKTEVLFGIYSAKELKDIGILQVNLLPRKRG